VFQGALPVLLSPPGCTLLSHQCHHTNVITSPLCKPSSSEGKTIWWNICCRLPSELYVLNGQSCVCRRDPIKKIRTPQNCKRFCRTIRWVKVLRCLFIVVLKGKNNHIFMLPCGPATNPVAKRAVKCVCNAAPSIAFYLTPLQAYSSLTQLPAVFLAGAATSIAFYLTLLEEYFYLTPLEAYFYLTQLPVFFCWRRSKHSFLSKAARSIFLSNAAPSIFIADAAPSAAFYLALLESYFHLTQQFAQWSHSRALPT